MSTKKQSRESQIKVEMASLMGDPAVRRAVRYIDLRAQLRRIESARIRRIIHSSAIATMNEENSWGNS